MKRMIVVAVALICTILNVAAQQKTSVLKQKGDQLAKAADADPQNWRKQFDAAEFFLSIEDTMQSGKYAQRALEIAQKMEVKKDTILPKSLELLSSHFLTKKDFPQMSNVYDMAIRAYIDEFGYQNKLIPPLIANAGCFKFMMYMNNIYPYGDVDCIRSLREATMLNNQLPEGQRATGIEEAETMYALAQETLLLEHRRIMKDKVWQWLNRKDNKFYTVLAFGDWTLEQPEGFIATMLGFMTGEKDAEEMKHGLILLDDQDKVTEMIHGDFDWNMLTKAHNGNFSFSETSSLRLVTVTPERRQQMINALNERRQQIMDDFKNNLDKKKTDTPMKISPGVMNFNRKINNGVLRFGSK